MKRERWVPGSFSLFPVGLSSEQSYPIQVSWGVVPKRELQKSLVMPGEIRHIEIVRDWVATRLKET